MLQHICTLLNSNLMTASGVLPLVINCPVILGHVRRPNLGHGAAFAVHLHSQILLQEVEIWHRVEDEAGSLVAPVRRVSPFAPSVLQDCLIPQVLHRFFVAYGVCGAVRQRTEEERADPEALDVRGNGVAEVADHAHESDVARSEESLRRGDDEVVQHVGREGFRRGRVFAGDVDSFDFCDGDVVFIPDVLVLESGEMRCDFCVGSSEQVLLVREVFLWCFFCCFVGEAEFFLDAFGEELHRRRVFPACAGHHCICLERGAV